MDASSGDARAARVRAAEATPADTSAGCAPSPSRRVPTSGFWAWSVLIWAIRSVTLVAFAWVAFLVARHAQTDPKTLPLAFRLFSSWMLLEAAYYPYWLVTRRRLNARSPAMHACRSQAERVRLLEKIIAATKITACADGAQWYSTGEWFLRWFRPTSARSPTFHVQDVRRGNLEEWIAWAAFDRTLESVHADAVMSADCAHLADLIERVLEMKFLPGHNPEITSIRLTIDPVYAAQRPLVYYAAISLLHALGAVGVGLLGFERRYVLGQTFLFRSAFADSQAPRTAPIIFCHGLGIGFLHYLRVLRQLPSSSDVYLLESPNITMSLGAETQRSIADTQALVRAMLHADGHSSACLVAHSFGTIVPSWLLTARDPSLGALVESVVLIDPISLLLYDPAVAYNFVHRTPATAVEIMMSYFVSQELYIAHTLARHFSWSHAALFLEDLPADVHVQILLSGADAIVPAQLVRAYVEQHCSLQIARPPGGRRPEDGGEGGRAPGGNCVRGAEHPGEIVSDGRRGGAEVKPPVWFENAAHGELMLKERYVAAISRSILAALCACPRSKSSAM